MSPAETPPTTRTARAPVPTPSAGGTDLAISVHGLRKSYGNLRVLDGLDLEARRGELLALLGPNGAGKTTTVEILEGYRRADGGEVRILGLDPVKDGALLRPRLWIMLQQGGITPQGRPGELVRLHARLFAHPANPGELLEALGLASAATRKYKLLSGGEKQRLAMALALVGRPELLVLDEPTAGMDPAAKQGVRSLIADLRAAGRTILLTTHELADVERLADRVVVIDHGRVVASGTPAELVAGTGPTLRFRLSGASVGASGASVGASGASVGASGASVSAAGTNLSAVEVAALSVALGGAVEADGGHGRYKLASPAPEPGLVATLASWCAGRGLLIAELRTSGGTLEERFLELIADQSDEGAAGVGNGAPRVARA